MAKSRGRKFAEITSPTSGVFDLTSVPTITNAKLQNSAMTLAGSSVSLGGTGVADTDALSEGSSNLYFTDARVQTFLGGGTLAGNIVVPDNQSIYLGSSSDFRMVHNVNNTQLINSTGALQITSNGGFDVTGAATFSSTITASGAINVDTIQNASGNLNILSTQNILLKFDSDNNQTNRELNIQNNSGDQILKITEAGAATFSGALSSGALTVTGGASFTDDVAINNGSPELYFGTTGNHYNWRLAAQEIVDAGFEIAVGSQDTDYSNDTYTQIFNIKNTGNATFSGSVTAPYFATTSYLDLNNSGNRGKIGWSGNHTYIATTSSVGSIIFKNNVGSTDAPQTGGDTLLTIADGGNATFSGSVTATGADFNGVVDISAGTNLNLSVRQLAFNNFSNEGVGITFSRTSSDADLMAIGVVDTSKLNIASRSGLIFSTGGGSTYAATSEVMRIDSSGNVGIGETNPGYKLHVDVDTSTNIPAVFDSSDTSTYLYIRNANAATGRKTYLAFAPANNIHGAAIYAEAMEDFSTSANRTADLIFETRNNGTITQHVRINSSGNLGVGGAHSETRRNLGLVGSTPGVHFIDSNVTNLRHEIVGGGNAGLEYSADYNNVGNGYHRFDIGGGEVLRIKEGGHQVQLMDGYKFFTLTDGFSVGANSTTNFKINISDYTGASAGGYCMYTVSVMGYASGGANGLNFTYTVAGYSGHNYGSINYNSYGAGTIANGASGSTQYNSQGISYHPCVNLGGYIASGSVWAYVPAAQQYGVTVVNTAGTGMACQLVIKGWSS